MALTRASPTRNARRRARASGAAPLVRVLVCGRRWADPESARKQVEKGPSGEPWPHGEAEGDAGDAAVAACLRVEVTPAISASSAWFEHVATSPAPSASKSCLRNRAIRRSWQRRLPPLPGRPGAAHTVTGARAAGERGSQDTILAGVEALGQQQDFAQAAARPLARPSQPTLMILWAVYNLNKQRRAALRPPRRMHCRPRDIPSRHCPNWVR